MSRPSRLILIHSDAPPMPAPGAPCNGCGVCCLLAPCPLGIVLSLRRQGACVAVRWHDEAQQYRCGALGEPTAVLQARLPRPWRRVLPWLAKRWIGVGLGCDSSLALTRLEETPGAAAISSTMRHDPPSGSG